MMDVKETVNNLIDEVKGERVSSFLIPESDKDLDLLLRCWPSIELVGILHDLATMIPARAYIMKNKKLVITQKINIPPDLIWVATLVPIGSNISSDEPPQIVKSTYTEYSKGRLAGNINFVAEAFNTFGKFVPKT